MKRLYYTLGCDITDEEWDYIWDEDYEELEDYPNQLASSENYLDDSNYCYKEKKSLVCYGDILDLQDGYFKVEEDYSLTRVEL